MVYVAVGATDLRKSINGLALLVEEQFELNLFGGSLFAFCNRRRDLVKILYWDGSGFCLWMKRLGTGLLSLARGRRGGHGDERTGVELAAQRSLM
ncbi:MAG: IS66 family insertion sequence element accessory protein TnpB [Desulfofustis sp. PB-SRB1]|nr:IS66 family insertion sequence element accessory protein TnpB [Desulfofustis sp. PB-SRB1]